VALTEAGKYSATETLRNGQRVEIRALKPEDRDNLLAAIGGVSAQSLYRRFFGAKRFFTEKEIAFFLNMDFVKHVALAAVAETAEKPTIIGGGRYVVDKPGEAEVAFMVIDKYQGFGLGELLLRHLAAIARGAGLRQFTAEVLPDNVAMLKVFEKSGLKPVTKRERGSVHVTLALQ
jgi:RimJ/RimL family protein N-acetyltransferase